MPVDMAMHEPWTRVIGEETERHFVSPLSDSYDIPTNGILEVILLASSYTNDIEGMSMKVNGVL